MDITSKGEDAFAEWKEAIEKETTTVWKINLKDI
jgi:hypothetical protein